MLNCFRPVWGLIILPSSKICQFLFHLFFVLSKQKIIFPNGYLKSDITVKGWSLSRFFALLLVRVGGEAGEQDRVYPPRKIHFPKGTNLARGVCVTGVMAQSKSDFSAIVSKLCLIS